jgi:hypothetical protein
MLYAYVFYPGPKFVSISESLSMRLTEATARGSLKKVCFVGLERVGLAGAVSWRLLRKVWVVGFERGGLVDAVSWRLLRVRMKMVLEVGLVKTL